MPPRARVASSDAFHGSFDPGVTGRRTGVAPPLKVRKTSNGIECFSDYFGSPEKDPSGSPAKTSSKRSHDDQPSKAVKPIPQRVRNDRPDKYHEIGERGRKTGISPPKNSVRDENGFEKFDDYLIKATEQTNKGIAKERRKSMMRKSISQAYNRKLSVATFVDDDDDDDQEEFMEESMSLATPDTSALHHQETRSSHLASGASNSINPEHRKTRSGLSDAIDQSTRTPNGSDLIDFDVVPEGPIHSQSRHKSDEEQPMTVPDDEDEDDVQNSGGMMANGYDDASVGSDGFDAQPAHPPSDEDRQSDPPSGLEDIVEVDEENEHSTTAGPNGEGDTSHISEPQPPKPRRHNPRPPPPAGGPRRGIRQRFPRLAHWRGERVVYGRSMTPDGNQKVIGMVDVVRVPDEPTSPFAASRKKRRAGLQKIKSESVGPDDITTHHAPEDGWDDKTRPNGIVYSYTKNKDCERAVVCTKKMATLDVEDQAGDPNSFQFQRVVKDSDFIAGGIMHIPVGGGKPLKPAKDNFYFFTVVEGAVSVHIHRTTFVVAPAGVFWVPRGNVYSIRNISQRTAKLTFAQARRATGDEPDIDSDDVDEEHSILQSNSRDASSSRTNAKKNGTHPEEPLPNNPKTRKQTKNNPATRTDASTSMTISDPRKKSKKPAPKKKKSKQKKQSAVQAADAQDEEGEQEQDVSQEQEQEGEEEDQEGEEEEDEQEDESEDEEA